MNRIKYIVTLLASCLIINSSVNAADEFVVTPKVEFSSGYTTRANHLGLQIQKNSAFVASKIELENKILTPAVGVTYFFQGEDSQQAVLDGSVSKLVGSESINVIVTGGVQRRIIDRRFGDSFTTYGNFRLNSFPVLTKIVSPYVSVSRDFSYDLFGTTVGLDRAITIKSVTVTPRVEGYFYDKHTSWLAGGSIEYTGIKYLKPYVDASYITSDTALAARKFEGNFALTAGIRIKF